MNDRFDYHACAIITCGLYIFTPFFTAVYIMDQLVLQTIYVLNKEILQFFVLKSAVYIREQFQIRSVLCLHVYGRLSHGWNPITVTTLT